MERRGFIKRLFGTAAAVVVAPSVFVEDTVAAQTPVTVASQWELPLGPGLIEQIEARGNTYEYRFIGSEKLMNTLDDLMAEDPKPTFFGTSFKPLKSKYHK